MAIRKLLSLALVGLFLFCVGCSDEAALTGPDTDVTNGPALVDKDGTETLGTPGIPISGGSGFVEGGVGMVDVTTGQINLEVAEGAAIQQVLLYWAGGSVGQVGDDTIDIDGTSVQGTLIGGPVYFFEVSGEYYNFSAYRADITDLGLVQTGLNSLTVSGFEFNPNGSGLDENNGCSVIVITDDSTATELSVLDGIDMAYFGFEPTLDATVPQTFAVTPADADRMGDLLLVAASVGEERPNRVRVTTSLGDQIFDDALGSNDGLTWDSLVLPVLIPAGDQSIVVQLISTNSLDAQGASLGWVAAGLAVALPVVADQDISGTVFVDTDADGVLGAVESGIGNVVLDLTDSQGNVTTVVTDADGKYLFTGPAGDYTVSINLNDHADFFNDDLSASFAPTTELSLPVSGMASGVDFGFVPDAEAILEDLDLGNLDTDGETLRYWKKTFRRALVAERSQRHGHHGRGRGHGHHHGQGCGHDENFLDGDELRALLTTISELYLSEPYQFSEGEELEEALRLLRRRPRTEDQELLRELFVTELNFVSGLGLVNEQDRVGVLISWGEGLLATAPGAKSADKGRDFDIFNAIQIFSAINTGGGGGVDE